MAPGRTDKLWSYVGLTRLWAWSLVGSAGGLSAVAVALQATERRGLDGRWWLMTSASLIITSALFYPFLGAWLARSALPSHRLPTANRLKGDRLAFATSGDWRRWGAAIPVILFAGSVMMMSFLIAQLGRGGVAEGVVIGVMLAWGAVTLRDIQRIDDIQRAEGRKYFASCNRPVAIAERLVWMGEPTK